MMRGKKQSFTDSTEEMYELAFKSLFPDSFVKFSMKTLKMSPPIEQAVSVKLKSSLPILKKKYLQHIVNRFNPIYISFLKEDNPERS